MLKTFFSSSSFYFQCLIACLLCAFSFLSLLCDIVVSQEYKWWFFLFLFFFSSFLFPHCECLCWHGCSRYEKIMEKYRIVMLHEMTAHYIKNDNENDSCNQNMKIERKEKLFHVTNENFSPCWLTLHIYVNSFSLHVN